MKDTHHNSEKGWHKETGINWKKLRKAVRNAQDAKRYEHTLGVEYTSAALAMRYGADVEKAMLAGLLHDCAKCFPEEKLLALCKKHGIPMTETECRNPFLLHAKAGAYLAQKKYGIDRPDVINAIACHTMGKKGMTLLDKILFVADYIEPGRKRAEGLPQIRNLAFQDLDGALLLILESTLNYLQSASGEIDPQTEETWEYYKQPADSREENSDIQ